MRQEQAIKGIGKDLREINCWAREEHFYRMASITAGAEWSTDGNADKYTAMVEKRNLSNQAMAKRDDAFHDMYEWMQNIREEYSFEYKVNLDGTISDLIAVDIRTHEVWHIIEDEDFDYRIERE